MGRSVSYDNDKCIYSPLEEKCKYRLQTHSIDRTELMYRSSSGDESRRRRWNAAMNVAPLRAFFFFQNKKSCVFRHGCRQLQAVDGCDILSVFFFFEDIW